VVEQIADGEVTPYLTDEVRVGDRLELSGPFGGYFVWEATSELPVLFVGGGSGVVPLLSMLRHQAATASRSPVTLLYAARTIEHVLSRDDLQVLAEDSVTPGGGDADARAASRLDGLPPPDRCRDARRGRVAGHIRTARVRLRTDRVRRGGR